MKIVMPVYDKRISPVFDWCMRVLVVEKLSDNTINKVEMDISEFSEIERIKVLESIGPRTLLCGGISLQLEGIFCYLGIDVISWISGRTDEILNLFLNDSLQPEKVLLPGARMHKNKQSIYKNEVFKNNDNGLTINLIKLDKQ